MRRILAHPATITGRLMLSLAVAAVIATAPACSRSDASPNARESSQVERGAYLVTIGGCNDCHTPLKLGPNGPEPDMRRMLSGHPEDFHVQAPAELPTGWVWAGTGTNTAFAGPWGVSFAANLTPDLETGFGVFSEESFIKAMRTGKHMGTGRPIMPPMPWPAYSHMTDDDLKAIYAYLQTIPAVRNHVPDAVVAPPAG